MSAKSECREVRRYTPISVARMSDLEVATELNKQAELLRRARTLLGEVVDWSPPFPLEAELLDRIYKLIKDIAP